MKINLIEYFEESLQHCPDKIAVIEKDKQITFCELGVKSKQIATALICLLYTSDAADEL